MESKNSAFMSVPSLNLPTLGRRANPDVPEDVVQVALLHLNDPNYDLSSIDTESTRDSFEMDDKHHHYGGHLSTGHSIRTSPSDYDTESRTDSRSVDSRMQIRSTDAFEYEDESPYAEVRAAVSNTDDPLMPVNTLRMWILGLFFTAFVSGINQFYALRYPSVNITALVVQLASLPAGKFLEHILPTTRFRTFGISWTLNPGPFNIKEHTVITVMTNVVGQGIYATDVILTQRIFFNQIVPVGYQLLLCLSSQVIGYAFAGLVRQFLVWPSAMIWPGALVNAALFNTLHRNYGIKESRHISRERFFLYVLLGSFVWYWFPGYIFTALSIFNWACWIAPNNIVVNQLFGTVSGLGMGLLTFDWSMISYVGSPLVVPWWAQVNTFVAFVIIAWGIVPIMYYSGGLYFKYLPMSAPDAFDNTGQVYDPTRVVVNGVFDVELYKQYSPLFLPATFVMGYSSVFAGLTAVISHTFVWYRHDIMRQLRRSIKDHRDVHSRLMSVYPEVPHLWYGILGAIALVLSIITIEVWDTKLPIWALLIAIVIGFVFCVPIGMLQAITNQTVPLQVLGELVVGYILPGRPVAMMVFKTYSYISMRQAVNFVGDLKLGHYMKIPPRVMFTSQVAATIVSVFVSVLVQAWMLSNIPDLCTPDQPSHLTCPTTNVFATAAIIWGAIGPQRIFSQGNLYYPFVYFFLIGAILPVPFYLLARRYPLSLWRYINVPVCFAGVAIVPPATGINFSSWFTMGAVFQYYMRRNHFRWWMRYNYILSAGLDSGIAIAFIVIFFAVQYPRGGINISWWGNNVWVNTLDAIGAPFTTLAPGDTFGPKTWS